MDVFLMNRPGPVDTAINLELVVVRYIQSVKFQTVSINTFKPI